MKQTPQVPTDSAKSAEVLSLDSLQPSIVTAPNSSLPVFQQCKILPHPDRWICRHRSHQAGTGQTGKIARPAAQTNILHVCIRVSKHVPNHCYTRLCRHCLRNVAHARGSYARAHPPRIIKEHFDLGRSSICNTFPKFGPPREHKSSCGATSRKFNWFCVSTATKVASRTLSPQSRSSRVSVKIKVVFLHHKAFLCNGMRRDRHSPQFSLHFPLAISGYPGRSENLREKAWRTVQRVDTK